MAWTKLLGVHTRRTSSGFWSERWALRACHLSLHWSSQNDMAQHVCDSKSTTMLASYSGCRLGHHVWVLGHSMRWGHRRQRSRCGWLSWWCWPEDCSHLRHPAGQMVWLPTGMATPQQFGFRKCETPKCSLSFGASAVKYFLIESTHYFYWYNPQKKDNSAGLPYIIIIKVTQWSLLRFYLK